MKKNHSSYEYLFNFLGSYTLSNKNMRRSSIVSLSLLRRYSLRKTTRLLWIEIYLTLPKYPYFSQLHTISRIFKPLIFQDLECMDSKLIRWLCSQFIEAKTLFKILLIFLAQKNYDLFDHEFILFGSSSWRGMYTST